MPNQTSPTSHFPGKVSLDCESLGVLVGLTEITNDGLNDGEVLGAVDGLAEGERDKGMTLGACVGLE